MSDLSIEQAIDEMRDLVRCRCHPAFTERKLHDPDCNCDSAEAVEVLANAFPAVQPEVKPLVWFEAELPSKGGGKFASEGYTIRRIEGLWLLDFAGTSKSAWRFSTLEVAKAAAQADYEARILAALKGETQ